MAHKRPRRSYEEEDSRHPLPPFVFYGTPLPPLDDRSRDDGSFVPVWKQEVTDERGRKRLHGAFTGGFSAGYFNTVGSKEGWTPASFVSSRHNRAKDARSAIQQKPEDFMDAEDLQEAEESRTIDTAEGFAGFGTASDTTRIAAAVDLFQPSGQTIGAQLLSCMGWKEGQGIGLRVHRAANLGDAQESDDAKHFFAPEDVHIISFPQKTNRKGLGYQGQLVGEPAVVSKAYTPEVDTDTLGHPSDEESRDRRLFAIPKSNRPKQKPKGGIGVGILNEDGSDDDDPFSMGPKISYTRVLGEKNRSKTGRKKTSGATNPLIKQKPVFLTQRLGNLKDSLRKCHDGRIPLEGFVLTDTLDALGSMNINDEQHRPQQIPADWHSSISEVVDEKKPEYLSTADAAKASTLTAKSRAELLGETQLPGKSIFDFLTPAARERLVAASGRPNLPIAKGEQGPSDPASSAPEPFLNDVPVLDREVAIQALNREMSGWMPYAEDEKKRDRYRAYLEFHAGNRQPNQAGEPGRLGPPAGVRREDWLTELHEFARAAQVFKPISGLMASRFTSSTALPHGQEPGQDNTLLSKPPKKVEDPSETAAKIGMFGSLTRSISNFYPTRLVCKRFGQAPPDHSNPLPADSAHTSANITVQPVPNTMQFKSFASAGFEHADKTNLSPSNPRASAAVTSDLDPDKNEALEQQKPGQAVFRAIFGSDDEDDE